MESSSDVWPTSVMNGILWNSLESKNSNEMESSSDVWPTSVMNGIHWMESSFDVWPTSVRNPRPSQAHKILKVQLSSLFLK